MTVDLKEQYLLQNHIEKRAMEKFYSSASYTLSIRLNQILHLSYTYIQNSSEYTGGYAVHCVFEESNIDKQEVSTYTIPLFLNELNFSDQEWAQYLIGERANAHDKILEFIEAEKKMDKK